MKILLPLFPVRPRCRSRRTVDSYALNSAHISLPISLTFLYNSAIIPHLFPHTAFHLRYFPRSPKPQAAVLGLIKFRDNTVFRAALLSHRTFSAFILLRFTVSIIMNRAKRAPEAMQSGEGEA